MSFKILTLRDKQNLGDNMAAAIAAIAAGGAAMAIGGLMMGAAKRGGESLGSGASGGGYSSGQANSPLSNLKIQFEGKLKGRDIYISGVRYVEELNRGT